MGVATRQDKTTSDQLLDIFLFETAQNIEHLETTILDNEQAESWTSTTINEIFRVMHTIKGSAAMMSYLEMSRLAHAVEDVVYYLREQAPEHVDYSLLTDVVFDGMDFIKTELDKVTRGYTPDGDATHLIDSIHLYLGQLKQQNQAGTPEAVSSHRASTNDVNQAKSESGDCTGELSVFSADFYFEAGCEMENVRAFAIVHNLEKSSSQLTHEPSNILAEESAEEIRQNGLHLKFQSEKTYDELLHLFEQTAFLREYHLVQINDDVGENAGVGDRHAAQAEGNQSLTSPQTRGEKPESSHVATQQSMISVHVEKLDKFMDLVGEMVIAESMVTHNPDLNGLNLENFNRAATHLRKITTELKDIALSIRMVPLAMTFHRMHRVVRDISKKVNKSVQLEIIGEDIEVDKNIIEHITDPLMHLVRNAVDHGIEPDSDRLQAGKTAPATVTLEACNLGSDVLVFVRDNGQGLDRNRLLQTAQAKGLLHKPADEMSDNEVYNLIFQPGFSTNKEITEFSGRGVGMDVVARNIEHIGGSVLIQSEPNVGTTITLKIPTTLAIIDGMNLRIGESLYTIPTTAILESFRPHASDLVVDPDGNELLMVRGEPFPVIRLHRQFGVEPRYKELSDGIVIRVANDGNPLCLFADELLGKQQVVVKALPRYVQRLRALPALAGCTLLGDGRISLIINVSGLAMSF